MENMKEATGRYSVWVDWAKQIISFEKAEGFQRLEFASHDEMFDFAVKKGLAGFGIQ